MALVDDRLSPPGRRSVGGGRSRGSSRPPPSRRRTSPPGRTLDASRSARCRGRAGGQRDLRRRPSRARRWSGPCAAPTRTGPGQELDVVAVRRDRGQMRGGGDRDPGLPEMRHDAQSALPCQLADAPRLRQPADPPDVRLATRIPPRSIRSRARSGSSATRPPRSGSAAPRRAGDSRPGRRARAASRRSRGRTRSQSRSTAQRGVGVRERVLHVDQQRDVRSDRLAHGGERPRCCAPTARAPLCAYGPPSVTSAFTARKPGADGPPRPVDHRARGTPRRTDVSGCRDA